VVGAHVARRKVEDAKFVVVAGGRSGPNALEERRQHVGAFAHHLLVAPARRKTLAAGAALADRLPKVAHGRLGCQLRGDAD
jgi:hypothetical protein